MTAGRCVPCPGCLLPARPVPLPSSGVVRSPLRLACRLSWRGAGRDEEPLSLSLVRLTVVCLLGRVSCLRSFPSMSLLAWSWGFCVCSDYDLPACLRAAICVGNVLAELYI